MVKPITCETSKFHIALFWINCEFLLIVLVQLKAVEKIAILFILPLPTCFSRFFLNYCEKWKSWCFINSCYFRVFTEHISRLSAVVSPSHPSLQINPKYMLECPWPSAQREVSALAAFRSPKGKLQAALRCCRAVMQLLKLADESHVPAADDFTPVLVFVLIKVGFFAFLTHCRANAKVIGVSGATYRCDKVESVHCSRNLLLKNIAFCSGRSIQAVP